MKEQLFRLLPFKKGLGGALVSSFLENPIFIVGSGRSGTTALARALDQHSQIMFSANEAPLGSHLAQIAFNYQLGPTKKWYRGNILVQEHTLHQELRRLLYESVWGEYFGLRKNVGFLQGSLARLKNLTFWGTKAFPTEEGALGLDWMFPASKYVYIIRNGIDVINSMSKFGGFVRMTFMERCIFWKTTVERYDYLRQRHNAITIRFEEFVTRPHAVMEQIEIHIGAALEKGPAEFAENNLVHPLGEDGTRKAKAAVELTNRPPAWLQWTPEEKQIFVNECGSYMTKLNYEIPF